MMLTDFCLSVHIFLDVQIAKHPGLTNPQHIEVRDKNAGKKDKEISKSKRIPKIESNQETIDS